MQGTRGRSTQRKTSHDVEVDRKPATKRSVVESFKHVDQDRKAPATAPAINNDDDNSNGDGKGRCRRSGVVRRPCSSH